MDASSQICDQLRRVGARSVSEVDRELLNGAFPEKWDLEDPCPKGKKLRDLNKMILRAHPKSVALHTLVTRVGAKSSHEIGMAHEMLWRVENWLRPELEDTDPVETRRVILGEAMRILAKGAELELRVATQSLLFEAERGLPASPNRMQQMRQGLQQTQLVTNQTNSGVPLGLDLDREVRVRQQSLHRSHDLET